MGTRFAASAESLWAEAMKKHLIAAGGDETEQTPVFDIVAQCPVADPVSRPRREECVLDPWPPREDRLRDNRAVGCAVVAARSG
jgi:hypothetical protein